MAVMAPIVSTAEPLDVQATKSQPVNADPPQILIDPTDGEQLVSVRDAAKIMGFAPRTVHGWVRRGLVEIRRTPVGQVRIVVRSLWRREPVATP